MVVNPDRNFPWVVRCTYHFHGRFCCSAFHIYVVLIRKGTCSFLFLVTLALMELHGVNLREVPYRSHPFRIINLRKIENK